MQEHDEVLRIVTESLDEKGLSVSNIDPEGRLEVDVDGDTALISLENVRAAFRDDQDPEIVRDFVNQLFGAMYDSVPDWSTAKASVMMMMVPSDIDLTDCHIGPLSQGIGKSPVYVSPDEEALVFLGEEQLKDWGVTSEILLEHIDLNMAQLMSQTIVKIEEMGQRKIGLLSTDSVFKSSLILSPAFKDSVSDSLGWPVYAIAPNRDFLYIVGSQDAAILPELGKTIFREFNESSFALSPEVLEVSDEGICAVGHYEKGGLLGRPRLRMYE